MVFFHEQALGRLVAAGSLAGDFRPVNGDGAGNICSGAVCVLSQYQDLGERGLGGECNFFVERQRLGGHFPIALLAVGGDNNRLNQGFAAGTRDVQGGHPAGCCGCLLARRG